MGALRACLDWVQVTFPDGTDVQQVVDNLGMRYEDFKEVPVGLYGYKKHMRYGHISVLTDGGPNMGVHLQMTGQGCREFETYSGIDWKQLMVKCFQMNGNFTRIDGAIDDIATEGNDLYFKLSTVRRKARDGAIRSRFRGAKSIRKIKLADGESMGETLYFGNEQSDIQVRMYEKDWERLAAGFDVEHGIIGWNRIEVQTRRDRANAMALYLVNTDKIGVILAGVIKNYIQICVKTGDSNKARWPVCEWWEDFLGEVEKLPLTMIAPDRTVPRALRWIEKQVAPTLGMIYAATNGNTRLLLEIIKDGMDRMTDEQMELAREYSDYLEESRLEREQERRAIWVDYLFRTGAHRYEKTATLGERNDFEE